MAQKISLTDLTDALQGPDGEKVLQDVRARLKNLQAKVDKGIKAGAPPAEFEKQREISAAVKCSIKIFETYTR